MAEKMHKNTLAAPLMAGMLGAGLALLFAPRSGQETRHKLRGKAQEMQDQAEENFMSARRSLEHSVNRMQELRDQILRSRRSDDRAKENDELAGFKHSSAMAKPESSVLSTWEEEV